MRALPLTLACALCGAGCVDFDRGLIGADAGGLRDGGRALDAAVVDDAGDDPTDGGPDACRPRPRGELCDVPGTDDDCDGAVDEGCECFGEETRSCTVSGGCEGTETCSDGAFGACTLVPVVESCNGADDDCDASVDEGDACASSGCLYAPSAGGGAYLFCVLRRTFLEARADCQANGYDLVTIEAASEHDAVLSGAREADASDRFWIGYNDIDGNAVHEWTSGIPVTYLGPGATAVGTGECAVLDTAAMDWGGEPCSITRRYICEAYP